MQYRKEIDGLRAIAVLPVILFHAGFQGFSGGYIGVDIFFVISGYLITSIILEDIKNNNFSIINFYERRARRILPALSIVLLFTTIAAYFLMPGDLLKEYSQSVISVTTFSSNVFFYLTSGYFSTDSDEKPLLHTWSLAVEEQFYVFFPIMIALAWPLGKKRLMLGISLFAILSLSFAQFLSLKNAVNLNFYLIFSRAWELFFGSLIAFLSLDNLSVRKWKRELIGTLGLAMIVYSIVFFDKHTPFPSFYTLIPVLGTCLIIVFCNAESLVGRFLSAKLFVTIGLISYSLYLWHQPLFAFLRLKLVGEPSSLIFAGAILATFVLAFLSWKYIENQFRNKKLFTRKTIFQYSTASIAIFITVGLAGHFNNGFEQRFSLPNYAETIAFSPKRNECHTNGRNYLKPESACKYYGEKITWASFGDSHIVEPAYALSKQLESHGIGLVHLTFSGCPPALLFDVKAPGCSKWLKDALNYLNNSSDIKNVLIGFRYTAFLFGNQSDSYPQLPNEDPGYLFADSFRGLSADDAREVYWKSFTEVVARLLKSGKNVYVLYPIPELPVPINKAVTPFSVFHDTTMIDLDKTTAADYYLKRNQFIIRKLDSLPYGKDLHAVKPFEILCTSEFCPAIRAGKALYFDDNHLSIAGATLIAKNIINDNQKLTNSNFLPVKVQLRTFVNRKVAVTASNSSRNTGNNRDNLTRDNLPHSIR